MTRKDYKIEKVPKIKKIQLIKIEENSNKAQK